jgi:hypothetical protein
VRQLQHGDVLLQEVEGLPRGSKKVARENGRIIVARGEATGHNHAIAEKGAVLYELKGDLYLEVTEPVTITHEEHKPIEIPEGIYEIGRVREHDYFLDMERQVRD